jgi:hypothetical protein
LSKRKTRYYFLKLLMSQNYRNGIPVDFIDAVLDDIAQQMNSTTISYPASAWEQGPIIPWGDWTPEQDAAFIAAKYRNGNGN